MSRANLAGSSRSRMAVGYKRSVSPGENPLHSVLTNALARSVPPAARTELLPVVVFTTPGRGVATASRPVDNLGTIAASSCLRASPFSKVKSAAISPNALIRMPLQEVCSKQVSSVKR